MSSFIQVLRKGVEYLVDTSDRAGKGVMHIKFCHKDEMGSFQHGVTSEGIIQMMINRYQHLIEKDDSPENIRVLLFLRQALEAINSRNTNKMKWRNENSGNGVSVSSRGEQNGQYVHQGIKTPSNNPVSESRDEPAS